jgi:hypothetical protein
MAAVCSTMSALLAQVEHVCLFRGASALISQGNQKCRQHAQQQLFTHSALLRDTVVSILLYDLEKENETDDGALDKDRRARTNPSVRDLARVHAAGLLAHFIHVDAQFKHSFFTEFCLSSIKAERSLRASFIQEVLLLAALLHFKQQLEPFLRARGLLSQEEYVLQLRFLEHAEVERGAEHAGTQLVIVTSAAYYVSTNTFPEDAEKQLLQQDPDALLAQCVYLERREFRDIVRLYRDFSAQGFAVRSYAHAAPARLARADMEKRTDVWLHRSQGVADAMLRALSQYARDDSHRVHTVAADEFTPIALRPLLDSCAGDGDNAARLGSNASIRLMTHVWVLRRDATLVKRVMLWVTDQANQANSCIIITPYSPAAWNAACTGEDAQEITPAGPWEPSRFPRLGKGSARSQEIAQQHHQQVQALFSVSAPSMLPAFMAALPSLPFGTLAQGGPFYFPVSELQSVDFTEDADTDMILRIRRTDPSRIPSVYVRFADDTGREMWRRELKKLFFGGAMGQWHENLLPDLSSNSRRKQQLL